MKRKYWLLFATLFGLIALAAVACGDESETPVHAGGELAVALQRSLGRWTRRKIRRALDDATPDDVRAIDPRAWRAALHGLAAERILEQNTGDLREAFEWLARRADNEPRSETDDLSTLLAGDPIARSLLWRLEERWCRRLLSH